jgi:SAM-dependent methyltransferase
MSERHTATLPASYFADIYASDPDPWRFTTSAYERDKYAATLASLPRQRYGAALEVGCSIGVFTRALAPRCDALTALDLAPAAIAAARARCADQPQVAFVQGAVPGDWPPGRFDLILFSEVLYFLDAHDLARGAGRVAGALAPGGECVLVHWLGAQDYPLSGEAAAEGFIAEAAGFAAVIAQTRAPDYRIDVLRARTSAEAPDGG